MEPDSSDLEPTIKDLERKKLELEVEQLQKEARIRWFLRPGYIGSLIAVVIPLASYFYLDRSGVFDRERRILELQKEELKADIRGFEDERESLNQQVAALRRRETALAEQLERLQEQYRVQRAGLERYSDDLGEMQWEYINGVIDEAKMMAAIAVEAQELAKSARELVSSLDGEEPDSCSEGPDADPLDRLDRSIDCYEQWMVKRQQVENARERTRAESEQIRRIRQISLDRHAEQCRTNRIRFTKKDFPVASEDLDRAVGEFRNCLSAWTPPLANEAEASGPKQ